MTGPVDKQTDESRSGGFNYLASSSAGCEGNSWLCIAWLVLGWYVTGHLGQLSHPSLPGRCKISEMGFH